MAKIFYDAKWSGDSLNSGPTKVMEKTSDRKKSRDPFSLFLIFDRPTGQNQNQLTVA